jgi:surfeit locus 1 family protein
MLKRLPLIPTVLVLIAVGVMIRLGFWQIDRMHEKDAMVASFEAALAQDGISPVQAHRPEAAYKRIQDNCTNPVPQSSVAGRNAKGEIGWAHVVRCTMGGPPANPTEEEQAMKWVPYPVDVVLGWSRAPQDVQWTGGMVTGTVVPFGKLGYKVFADPPLAGLEANAKPDPRDIPNNHWSYAIQWFLFALVALVIYGLALRKRLAGA